MFDPIAVLERTFVTDSWRRIMNTMDFGTHVVNPYHNTTHMKLVAYHAYAAYTDGGGDPQSTLASELTLAALFHDYNHSGGFESDTENIEATLRYLRNKVWAEFFEAEGVSQETVFDLIRMTQYNGPIVGFPHKPQTLAEKSIRDADLCMIYTPEGRALLVGLFEEFNRRPITSAVVTSQHVNDFFKANCKFLYNAEYYTPYGIRMRDTHLLQSLEEFRLLLQDLTGKTIDVFRPPEKLENHE